MKPINDVPSLAEQVIVLRKFANHRDGCHCFICRNLTDRERRVLQFARISQ